ncbi:nuclear transport factor 2 family protein [Flavitalea sp.]|nr:nuclear transport factor 2 family protein [Flavitalea sp.]
MKKVTSLLILCLIGASLKAQQDQQESLKYHSLEIKNKKTMNTLTDKTEVIMKQFNDAFQKNDPSLLKDIISPSCIMESIQGPDGARYEGYDACFDFWKTLASDSKTHFDIEEVFTFGDRATIRWRYSWGSGKDNAVRGVTLMRVLDGKIIEALGYAKTVTTTGLDN